VAAVATPFVIVAVAVPLFLNPIWVGFDQGRSDVTGLTGYSQAQVQAVTGSILSNLVFGPPDFTVALTTGGPPVLDDRERTHMADVRNVLLDLGLVALVAAVLLVGVGAASRGSRPFWRAVALGGRVVVAGVVIVGAAFILFFDQAFEAFHEIFFPPGTYMFDPRTEKLVQLFPDQFWSETSVAISLAVLALALGTTFVADRLGGEPDSAAGPPAGAWVP